MAHSQVQNYVHIIYSTKNRYPYLHDKSIRAETFAYLGGICKRRDTPPLIVGGVADHVHILCRLSQNYGAAAVVRDVKRASSKWLKRKDSSLESFYWQEGYGLFSVGPSQVDVLRRYIANQEKHHRTETFQDEFRRILRRYNIEYKEPDIWK